MKDNQVKVMTSVNLGFFDTPIHEATAAAIIRVF